MLTAQPEMIANMDMVAPEAPSIVKSHNAESLFGPLTFPEHELFHFPWGLLGLPHLTYFGLSDTAQKKFEHTWLFQTIPSSTHSFMAMPIKTSYFEGADIDKLCAITGINPENLGLFCMLNLTKEGEKLQGTINLQAPPYVWMGKVVLGASIFLRTLSIH